jgi:hypothetical protein
MTTGFVGGIDVGVGVLAYLVVDHETGQPLLAAAAWAVSALLCLHWDQVVKAGHGRAGVSAWRLRLRRKACPALI